MNPEACQNVCGDPDDEGQGEELAIGLRAEP